MDKDKNKTEKKIEFKKFDPKKYIETNPNMREAIDELVEAFLTERDPLTLSQRRKRALTMKRYKNKIALARKRASKKRAPKEVLMRRARKKARNLIKQRLAKSKNYSEMSPAEKSALDKRMLKISARRIDTLAKRQLPKVRAAEKERFKSKVKNESVRQDADIADKKGTQPSKYYTGLAPSTKDKRDAHFKRGANMDDNNPSAYKPAPGDAEAKTKPSTHTKKFQQMFGEGSIEELFDLIEAVDLMMENAEKSLKNKAKETGISYGILKKVFDRGVAAWRTGHRPGTNPVQWGLARVNSFATKGKGTWGKADSDLASQVKKESFNEDDSPCWDGYRKVKGKKDFEKGSCVKEIFTEEDLLEFEILDEAGILDKALSAIHKHVMKGIPLMDIAYDVSRAAGVNMSGRQLEKEYINQYGEPQGKKTDPAIRKALKKKYGFKMEGEYADAAKAQIEREKEADQRRFQRMMDSAQERDAEASKEKKESANPSDREEGTNSLVKIYKKATPGQKINEAALNAPIRRGDRVSFNHDTVVTDETTLEGIFVGTDPETGRMRIRDNSGKLFIVKHENVTSLVNEEIK